MELISKKDIHYIERGGGGFEVLFLTRLGGASSSPYDSLNMSYSAGDDKGEVDKNHEKVFDTLSIRRENLVRLNQVHGSDILTIKSGDTKRVMTGDFDAVVTDDVKLCLSVLTADCVPIFLYDTKREVFAAVHTGWRGTALCIVKKAVNTMEQQFSCDASDIHAVLGPAIGECCYEVGGDVIGRLACSLLPGAGKIKGLEEKRACVDLKGMIKVQLRNAGLSDSMIESVDQCTCCRDDLFFSFRRDGVTGRQLSLIRCQVHRSVQGTEPTKSNDHLLRRWLEDRAKPSLNN